MTGRITHALRSDEAEFSVFTPGILDVLSIGKGDLRLSVGTSPADRARAKELIGEMLEKGYAIFVETDDGPVRVLGFVSETMTYIIPDADADEILPVDPPDVDDVEAIEVTAPKPHRTRKRTTHVPVEGSRATAVGRTSGG